MQEIQKIEIKPKLKERLKTWRFWKHIVAAAVGGLAGFLYYYFVGCNSGTCAITSSPYMSTFYGSLMGLFVVNSPCARGRC